MITDVNIADDCVPAVSADDDVLELCADRAGVGRYTLPRPRKGPRRAFSGSFGTEATKNRQNTTQSEEMKQIVQSSMSSTGFSGSARLWRTLRPLPLFEHHCWRPIRRITSAPATEMPAIAAGETACFDDVIDGESSLDGVAVAEADTAVGTVSTRETSPVLTSWPVVV